MFPRDVKTPEKAVAYLVDCTLATIEDMAMKKSRPVWEYERQKEIAQMALDWMSEMHISPEGTRAKNILGIMTVDDWAKGFEVKR